MEREWDERGSRCWVKDVEIWNQIFFLKHFRQLQDSSTPEVSSTNTRIKTSKINKSFAGSFFTIRVMSSLDYTFVSLEHLLHLLLLRIHNIQINPIFFLQVVGQDLRPCSNNWRRRNGRQMLAKLYIAYTIILLLFSSSSSSFQTIITFSLSLSLALPELRSLHLLIFKLFQ